MSGKGGRFPLGLDALGTYASLPAVEPSAAAPRRWPWAVAACLLGGSIIAALWPAGGVAQSKAFAPTPAAAGGQAPVVSPASLLAGTDDGPEGRLMAAYQLLAAGDIAQATLLSEALATSHPNFALGQLLQADLLAARAGQVGALGSALAPVAASARAAEGGGDLAALQLEAQRRLDALRARPPEGTVPAELLLLPPSMRTVMVVDVSRSRLYLIGNGADGLTVLRDYYVSSGLQGVDKRIDGDQRTPLGVYWITNWLNAQHIDARFGQGAMGINYPNAWDRSLGRGGRGLFVHGVPADTLARLPQATDGCIALANDDLLELAAATAPGQTPVLIARQLNWVVPQAAAQGAAGFRAAYDSWNQARMAGDQDQARRWHDAGAQIEEAVAESRAPRQELSLIAWNGDDQRLVVATSRQARAGAKGIPVRQYWVQRDGQWRIFFEGQVPASASRSSPAVPVWTDAAARQVAGTAARPPLTQATSGRGG
ncbi:MAG: L,D-transpeptidase family protein [Aquabacterium sp.]|nr:L,D-transpeptidase family protein [Aquabacterium sp.]